jgi:hypothetical protein
LAHSQTSNDTQAKYTESSMAHTRKIITDRVSRHFHRQPNMICLNDCYIFAESTGLEVQTKFHSTDIDSTLRPGMKHPIANAPQPKAKRRKHQESSGRTLPTTPINSRHFVEHATVNSPAGSSTPQLASTAIPQKQQPNRKVVTLKPCRLPQIMIFLLRILVL